MCKVSQGCVFAWLRFWPTLCVCGAVGDFGFRDFGIGQENSVRPSAVHRPIGRLCIWLTLLLCLITTRTFTYWFFGQLEQSFKMPVQPFFTHRWFICSPLLFQCGSSSAHRRGSVGGIDRNGWHGWRGLAAMDGSVGQAYG